MAQPDDLLKGFQHQLTLPEQSEGDCSRARSRQQQTLFLMADMRYDERMRARCRLVEQLPHYWIIGFATLFLFGCVEDVPEVPTTTVQPDFEITSDPARALTLQANTEATALWLTTQTPPVEATEEQTAIPANGVVSGTPLSERVGECQTPEGYVRHTRQGFCIGAPEGWKSLNVDGGVAATLKTTPGQAISLQPDWAASSSECHLMIYVTTGRSVLEHLLGRYEGIAGRNDLVTLSPIEWQSLGDGTALGFTWSAIDGETGGIYVVEVGANQLAHISQGGTLCPLSDLLPVIETLRFR
jgi:hypothetical protein